MLIVGVGGWGEKERHTERLWFEGGTTGSTSAESIVFCIIIDKIQHVSSRILIRLRRGIACHNDAMHYIRPPLFFQCLRRGLIFRNFHNRIMKRRRGALRRPRQRNRFRQLALRLQQPKPPQQLMLGVALQKRRLLQADLIPRRKLHLSIGRKI